MRKLQIFACILLVLSLAACGTANTPASSSDTSDTQPETTTAQSAETILTEETTTTDAPVAVGPSYAEFADLTFTFSSGAGGWQTTMYIAADGSFTGEHFDAEMTDTDDSYPNGTQYISTFSGQFAPLTQVDDLTYTTTIASITYANTVETEEIRDGVRYVYTTAYGLDDAKTLYFYLPGTETAKLDDGCMSWVSNYLWNYSEEERAKLPFVVLFNENAETAFEGVVEG